MLDMDYVKQLLQMIGKASYRGVDTSKLVSEFLGRVPSHDELLKFKYHMDEIWDAGLIKGRDGPGENGWGYQYHRQNMVLVPIPIVLTPLGSELLKELSKPRGAERLKNALRTAGSIAGTEAFKQAVGELLKASVS